MDELVNIFVIIFEILNSIKILNVSILVWAVIPILIALIIDFIKGKKE